MPAVMVWERLMAEPRLKGEIPLPAEGSILPDSYAFTTGESRAAVVKRMQAAMDKAFAELWATRTPRTAVKNRNEAITLASIVAKETAVPADRKSVEKGQTASVRSDPGGCRSIEKKYKENI